VAEVARAKAGAGAQVEGAFEAHGAVIFADMTGRAGHLM
jgi:hypothetical protein